MMVWYADRGPGYNFSEVFVSSFFEDGDFEVKVKNESLLKKTENPDVFYTNKENLIYLEDER